MKNLSNFAAQQLTKKQMNEVTGGRVKFKCVLTRADGSTERIKIKADDLGTAIGMMWGATPEGGSLSC